MVEIKKMGMKGRDERECREAGRLKEREENGKKVLGM
jgi:hypothetical protein